jgi:hypothetical protein
MKCVELDLGVGHLLNKLHSNRLIVPGLGISKTTLSIAKSNYHSTNFQISEFDNCSLLRFFNLDTFLMDYTN